MLARVDRARWRGCIAGGLFYRMEVQMLIHGPKLDARQTFLSCPAKPWATSI